MTSKSKALKKYCMPLKEAIQEHKRIVPELRKAGLKKEAKIQEKELKGYEIKRMDYCPACHGRKEHVKHGGYKLCKTCGYIEEEQ